MQEQLRQKLIDEPLLEYQEQFSEDPVQPMTREDAIALTDLLADSLPLGSIQVGLRQSLVVITSLQCVQQGARWPFLQAALLFGLNAWPEVRKSDIVVHNRLTSMQMSSMH